MGVAPKPVPQLYPTPRASGGLTDAYTDILGGEPLQSNMAGTQTAINHGGISAVVTVVAGGPTGKQVIIPESWFGGNVTWVRGLFALSVVPRYSDFMADFTGPDLTNYADFDQAATNDFSGGVLSTTIPVLASVAVGTQLQAYYSYRDGTRSIKGQAVAGYPSLHTDPYQGTANDGDNYLMHSLYHAYHTSLDEKYRDLADRIGLALLDAGRFDSNHFAFSIPFSAAGGQVGFYSYNAPTTPFAVDNDAFGLNIKTTVNTGGPPYNYAGFGLWPTIPIIDGFPFRSLDIRMIGDGSGRKLPVNLNIAPDKGADGDYYYQMNMLPQDSYASVLYSIKPADLWKSDNVVYDSAHQDFSYVGTYGSDVATLQDFADVPRKRMLKRFNYNFAGNGSGYAGMYMGPASASSESSDGLHVSVYSAHDAVATLTATDSADVDHVVYLFLRQGWTDLVIPWVGSIPATPISTLPEYPEILYYPQVQNPDLAGLYFGADQVGFSQTAFTHPMSQIAFDAVYKMYSIESPLIFGLRNKGVPLKNIPGLSSAFYIPGSDANTVAFDAMSYGSVVTMADVTPSLFNGLQISFPSNDLGTEYNVTFNAIDFQIDVLDGPVSDPTRYQGIPRYTYKWQVSNGFVGYGSWRGPSSPGYLWASGWHFSGIVNPDNGRAMSAMILDFLEDAQNEYKVWFPDKQIGPFLPRYGRTSWEALNTPGYVKGVFQSGTLNTWYYPDFDDWYGYTYRALLSVAQYYFYTRSAQAKSILDNWMAWLDVYIIADGDYWWPPSAFNNDGTVGYTYHPVYAYTCIASACILKYWVDGDPLAQKWYRRLLDDMFARQRQTATGGLAGIYPTAEGSGYTFANLVFTVNAGATAPVATAFIAGGKITHYEVTDPGSGITSLTFTIDGDGSGAAGNAYLNDDLVGAFSDSHAGWELSEIFNTYAMVVLGDRPGGTVSYPITPTADDIAAFEGLIDFYIRTSRDARPSACTAHWMPLHEWRVDPYHNGAGIENPMISDTHAKGAMWTETIGPTFFAAVEYARYTSDWSWVDALYSLVLELTGNIRSKELAVFPTLEGLSWEVKTTPTFNTITHRSISGYEVRAALMQYPLWQFSLSYEFLRNNAAHEELKTLLGFFLARQGSFNAFLYSNPNDNTVTDQLVATGDGSTKDFQLIRSYGGFIEPVQNLNGSPVIKVDGAAMVEGTDYTVSPTGMLSLSTAPASTKQVTWSGAFYYRVRFLADQAEFNEFMKDLFELKQLEFVGSTMNKV
ncbi:DUF2460 domain-containing protein [Limnobacter litoralis]|uniref:DUF2460 domain-containing protein n=1 Tax=Limnobacter litoralis TaxID=481366 RepID=A0ABQ5YRI4_9BURK|nr:DUF2460 domain-containing protein [Limnobacter litoralis]GLR26506.1 hypothetical protein GCM10007875_15960 [Limnobacter litoralis]